MLCEDIRFDGALPLSCAKFCGQTESPRFLDATVKTTDSSK
jgi:hypothetical protein